MKTNRSLRKKFITRILPIFLLITLVSGGIQLYFMNQQIQYEIYTQSEIIINSIEQGILETDLAKENIEHQIDLKMARIAQHIDHLIQKDREEEITTEELMVIQEKLALSGLTIFIRKDDDIVSVKSTDTKEIGFSAKNYGDMVYQASDAILRGEKPSVQGAYAKEGLLVLPIMQSGVHKESPLFLKYAYYHPEGTDYFISPYIEASEVHHFMQRVGPEERISQMELEMPFVKEIAVLDPKVFKDPGLETKYWPPLRKVVFGDFLYQTEQDVEILELMADHPEKQKMVQKVNGEKIIKMFLPIEKGKVIYLGLDYEKMTGPLYSHSIILIVTGVVSLVVLFLIIASFFNQIYENIQRLKTQMKLLAAGDLTAKSKVADGSELESLSENANKMVDHLKELLRKTNDQAEKAQHLSVLLEKDASQSVEKIFNLSMDTTTSSRDQLDHILEFLDFLESYLYEVKNEEVDEDILDKIEAMREVAKNRTAATTDMTITLSDLLKSLHGQSSQLSELSNRLLQNMSKFKLKENKKSEAEQ